MTLAQEFDVTHHITDVRISTLIRVGERHLTVRRLIEICDTTPARAGAHLTSGDFSPFFFLGRQQGSLIE